VTAVVVWPRKPTHRELLDARLARGWKPMPSGLVSGPRVLGYAACVFEHPDTGRSPHHHPPLWGLSASSRTRGLTCQWSWRGPCAAAAAICSYAGTAAAAASPPAHSLVVSPLKTP